MGRWKRAGLAFTLPLIVSSCSATAAVSPEQAQVSLQEELGEPAPSLITKTLFSTTVDLWKSVEPDTSGVRIAYERRARELNPRVAALFDVSAEPYPVHTHYDTILELLTTTNDTLTERGLARATAKVSDLHVGRIRALAWRGSVYPNAKKDDVLDDGLIYHEAAHIFIERAAQIHGFDIPGGERGRVLHESIATYIETRFIFLNNDPLASEGAIYEHVKERFGTEPTLSTTRQRCRDNRYRIGPRGFNEDVRSVLAREPSNYLTPELFIQAIRTAIDVPRVMAYHPVDCWMH